MSISRPVTAARYAQQTAVTSGYVHPPAAACRRRLGGRDWADRDSPGGCSGRLQWTARYRVRSTRNPAGSSGTCPWPATLGRWRPVQLRRQLLLQPTFDCLLRPQNVFSESERLWKLPGAHKFLQGTVRDAQALAHRDFGHQLRMGMLHDWSFNRMG